MAVRIIPGNEMEKFMNNQFSISFGNMDDDEMREVSERAEYYPINDSELSVLKKFGLDCFESGSFYFEFEDK